MTDVRLIVTDMDVAALGDEWETLVSAGQAVAEAHDRNRWLLGDLGGKIDRRYGHDSLGKYAFDINIRPTTMYDYAACSAFYPEDDRAAFPPLNWSHYRAAMRVKNHEMAMVLLAKAADNGWTVEELADAVREANGNPPRPKKLTELEGAEFLGARVKADRAGEVIAYELTFCVSAAFADAIQKLVENDAYTLKVYGMTNEENHASAF